MPGASNGWMGGVLRRDEAQFAAVQQARLIEALKKRGVSAQLIEEAERELHAA